MSKGKKRCYFCGCGLTNQNRDKICPKSKDMRNMIWVDCCHKCKSKEDKKP